MLEKSINTQPGSAWLKCGENFGNKLRGIKIGAASRTPQVSGLSFYAPDFAGKLAEPWLIGEELGENELPMTVPAPALRLHQSPKRAEFLQQHSEILQELERFHFQKVVPVVFETFEFAEPLRLGMYWLRAVAHIGTQFAYGFEFLREGMCGLTPEVLFSVKDGILSTMALAGTGALTGPSLLEDAKETLEHKLVVENIRHDLEAFGTLQMGDTTEKPYGQLKHLHTPITLILERPVSFTQLVELLHPTAALGGWPRDRASAWLAKQSYHLPRRRFGAPFGFVSGEEMLCVVAIRGLQWEGTRALLGAGCGVVKGSVGEREWSELELKREAVRRNLGIVI